MQERRHGTPHAPPRAIEEALGGVFLCTSRHVAGAPIERARSLEPLAHRWARRRSSLDSQGRCCALTRPRRFSRVQATNRDFAFGKLPFPSAGRLAAQPGGSLPPPGPPLAFLCVPGTGPYPQETPATSSAGGVDFEDSHGGCQATFAQQWPRISTFSRVASVFILRVGRRFPVTD